MNRLDPFLLTLYALSLEGQPLTTLNRRLLHRVHKACVRVPTLFD